MFRENKRYQQVSLFGTLYQLPTGVKKILDKSWAPAFRKLIFEGIDPATSLLFVTLLLAILVASLGGRMDWKGFQDRRLIARVLG